MGYQTLRKPRFAERGEGGVELPQALFYQVVSIPRTMPFTWPFRLTFGPAVMSRAPPSGAVR
jgi:hypothetical protein